MSTSTRVLPEHCFLLSNERVQEFQNSGVEATKENILSYVGNILRGGSLSDLANQTQIDIGIIIYLSNFANTYNQLKSELGKSSSDVLRYIPFDIFVKVLRLFPNFKLSDISSIEAKWVELEKEERNKKENDKRKKYFEGMRYLLGFFFLENNDENHRAIRESEIGNIFVLDKVREYCEEELVFKIGDIKLQNFLLWYARKHNLTTDPDSLQSLELLLSGVPNN